MKINGTNNFITDQDILVTSPTGGGNQLSSVLKTQQDSINELKSNVKWIYKYGGVGSGSGGGGGAKGSWKASISINNAPVVNNQDLDLSPFFNDGVVHANISVTISNPSAGGYRFAVLYKYGGMDYLSAGPALVVDNSYSISWNVDFSSNSTLVIKVIDIENNFNEYSMDYYVQGYDRSVLLVDKKDDGTESIIEQYEQTTIKSGTLKNGLIFRATVANYAGFNIKYWPVSTLPYSVVSINGKDPTEYNSEKGDGTKSYYSFTERDGKDLGFLAKDTAEVVVEYLITYETLATESNFGNQVFRLEVAAVTKQGEESNPYIINYSNVPDEKQYIIYVLDNISGSIYNNNSEQNPDPFFSGNMVTLRFRPFNYTSQNITLGYTLFDNDGNIYKDTFRVTNGRYTAQSFMVYNGWNKLVIDGIDDTIWYYGKQLEVSLNWYPDIELGSAFQNQKKVDLIKKSYFRFNNGLSNNLAASNQPLLNSAKVTGYYKSIRTTNTNFTSIDMWGNDFQLNDTDTGDIHIAIGIQYSTANDYSLPILDIRNAENDVLFTLYREKIACNKFASGEFAIYVPTTEQFTASNKKEFHLIDLYIKKVPKITYVHRNEAGQNEDKTDNIWKLGQSQDVENKWAVQVYIDGITDGVLTDFITVMPHPKTINIYNVNAYFNLFEFAQCTSQGIEFTDVDATLYWYTYRQFMTENQGINDRALSLVTNLAKAEADNTANLSTTPIVRIKHNMVQLAKNYVDTIAGNSDIPVYIIKVPHLNTQDPENTVFLWMNKEYDETESVGSWPVLSTSRKDGETTVTDTGISYYAPGNSYENVVSFPTDGEWSSASFKLDLQGSSTRKNHGKNLDLTVEGADPNKTYLYSPNYDINDDNTFLPEKTYTLKGDIVDSGHTNNVVMGKFINDNTTKFADARGNSIHGGFIKNCLTGYPCIVILAVDYQVSGSNTEYYYLGIYNFNLGRKSYSNLGYRDVSVFDGKISSVTPDNPFTFFVAPSEQLEIKPGFGCAEITGGNKFYDFSQYDPTVLFRQTNEKDGNTFMFGDMVTRNESILQNAIKLFVKDVALSGGYIFNRLGRDAVDMGDWTGWNQVNKVPNVKKQYKKTSKNNFSSYVYGYDVTTETGPDRWDYVFEKTLQSNAEIADKTYFSRLDYTSALEYYTICMAFGLVDSVQKNLNIKTWTLGDTNRVDPDDGEIRSRFYIAFYDMDTCLGIDNNSQETSPFCFSDYWESSERKVSDSLYHLDSIKVYRDYYPNANSSDNGNTDNKVVETGYDIPSSFLFSIVKYGTAVYNQGREEQFKIAQQDYQTPTDLWARYRCSSESDSWGIGTGSLISAQKFMDEYYIKHLSGVSEMLFNLDYKAKYTAFRFKEAWVSPADSAMDIGTYSIDVDNLAAGWQDYFHQDLTKFRGRSIHRVYDWLSSRLHILDAYFNLTTATEYASVAVEGDNAIPMLNVYNEQLLASVDRNADVHTRTQMFNKGGQTKFAMSPTTIQVRALKYTPLMFIDAGTIKERYLLQNPGYTYELSMLTNGNVDLMLAGSMSLTYMSNITWVRPAELSITSAYITEITGRNPASKVKMTGIDCAALQTISLTGTNYAGSLTFKYREGVDTTDTYANLQTIDINGSQIELIVEGEPVKTINASNVNANSLTITNCKNLQIVNGVEPVNLSDAKFTSQCSINVNWSQSIEFNNFETPDLSVTCTYPNATNNTIVIDAAAKTKFQNLKTISISGYQHIIINKCPKLQSVSIADPTNVKTLVIYQCATTNDASDFRVYTGGTSSSSKTINLQKCTNLDDFCFEQTRYFTNVILPTCNLKGCEFNNCTELTYLEAKTADGGAGTITIVDNAVSRKWNHVGKTSSIVTSSRTGGIFYNCNKFTLKTSASGNTPLYVSPTLTSLKYLFYLSNASANITLASIQTFIDNIPAGNKITYIDYMCYNQRGIVLDINSYKTSLTNQISPLRLYKFVNVSSATYAFANTSYIDNTYKVYISEYMWKDRNGNVFGKNATTVNVSCMFTHAATTHVYFAPNAFWSVIGKFTQMPFQGGSYALVYHPVFTNAKLTFNINIDDNREEVYWDNCHNQETGKFTKTVTYTGSSSNVGSVITGTTDNPVFARFIYFNADDTIKPLNMKSIHGMDFDTTVNWDFYGLFTINGMPNVSSISWFMYQSNTYKAQHYEDLLGENFLPNSVTNIVCSFRSYFNTSTTSVDLPRILAFDKLITKANTVSDGIVLFSNNNSTNIDYDTMLVSKYIDGDIANEWLNKIVDCKRVKGVRALFRNASVYFTDENNVSFKISSGKTPNNTVINFDKLFQNCKCYVGEHNGTKSEEKYVDYDEELFKYFPKIACVASMFQNTKWSHGIPFNFFNKRVKDKDNIQYYIIEHNARVPVRITTYKYNAEISNLSSCFAGITWNTETKANTYSGNPDNIDYNNITYGAGCLKDGETEIITSNIKAYTGTSGSTSVTIYPSYEYIDTLHLHGKFKQGDFDRPTGASGGVPYQAWPITGTDPAYYMDKLILPPDILYGCTASCYMTSAFSQNGKPSTALTGILPKHLLKYISNPTGSTGGLNSTFKDCLVIPNYVGTYARFTDSNATLIYDIYSFIPEEFITSSTFVNLNHAFEFVLHAPEQGNQIGETVKYTYYTLMMRNSIPKSVTDIGNAFPTAFPNGSSMRTRNSSYVNWHTVNRGLHFNIMLNCHKYVQSDDLPQNLIDSVKPVDIVENDPDVFTLFDEINEGFDLSYFTNCRVDNMYVSLNMLHIYFGRLFNDSAIISTFAYSSQGTYCMKLAPSETTIYSSDTISCNLTFPRSISNTGTRFLEFIESSQTNTAKYKVYENQFIGQDSLTSYRTMFDRSINIVSGSTSFNGWIL